MIRGSGPFHPTRGEPAGWEEAIGGFLGGLSFPILPADPLPQYHPAGSPIPKGKRT